MLRVRHGLDPTWASTTQWCLVGPRADPSMLGAGLVKERYVMDDLVPRLAERVSITAHVVVLMAADPFAGLDPDHL
jgi:hypothetical protein